MAQRLLKHLLPLTQTAGGISCPAKRNFLSGKIALFNNKDCSLSFCAYRYWSNLQVQQKVKYEDSLQPKNYAERLCLKCNGRRTPYLDVQQQNIIRHFSQSSRDNQITKAVSRSGNAVNSDKNKHVKNKKSPVKEFTVKSKISDHDMSIKITKMQNLLAKGKPLTVFIKHGTSSESSEQGGKTRLQEKLRENLQGVKTLRVDYSNANMTKLTVLPAIEEDDPTTEPEPDTKEKRS